MAIHGKGVMHKDITPSNLIRERETGWACPALVDTRDDTSKLRFVLVGAYKIQMSVPPGWIVEHFDVFENIRSGRLD